MTASPHLVMYPMAETFELRRTVAIDIPKPQDFLRVYFSRGDVGGVLVGPEVNVRVGDLVDLEFHLGATGGVVHAQGIARWRRPTPQGDLPAGTAIEFIHGHESTRDLLLDFGRGKEVSLIERADTRYPAVFVVEYATDEVFFTDLIADISNGGCFLRTDRELGVGQVIRLKLLPPGFPKGIRVDAEVSWRRGGEGAGVGLRFVSPGWLSRRKLRKMFNRIQAQIEETR